MNILNDNITQRMPSGILTIDRNGAITGFNPASERIFRGTLKLNVPLPDLVRERQALKSLLEKCLRTGETFSRIEFNVPVTADTDKRIGINLSPFSSAAGEIEGAICLLSDLTEIVDLQNQIKLKENFAALGEMSAGIAHEFKNSLATILGYAQMSIHEPDVDTLHAYAREIHKESQGLAVMVTDFLNFARPIKAAIHEVDLEDLLSTVISDLKNLRPGGYTVTFDVSSSGIVTCDATLIRQTFLNLLINAVESLPDASGTLAVAIEEAQRGHVRVSIEDNGCGIPSHQLSKIFLPFFTTKTHGTGLGLALVQKIVLAHNGRIEVQSNEGRGTRFLITLPRIPETSK